MKKLMTVVVSALCAGVAFTSLAETITWTGAAGDGLFWTAGNWDLNRAPVAASDDIALPASETPYTVTVKKDGRLQRNLDGRQECDALFQSRLE